MFLQTIILHSYKMKQNNIVLVVKDKLLVAPDSQTASYGIGKSDSKNHTLDFQDIHLLTSPVLQE